MLRVARARIITVEKQLKDTKIELEALRRKHNDLEQLVYFSYIVIVIGYILILRGFVPDQDLLSSFQIHSNSIHLRCAVLNISNGYFIVSSNSPCLKTVNSLNLNSLRLLFAEARKIV